MENKSSFTIDKQNDNKESVEDGSMTFDLDKSEEMEYIIKIETTLNNLIYLMAM